MAMNALGTIQSPCSGKTLGGIQAIFVERRSLFPRYFQWIIDSSLQNQYPIINGPLIPRPRLWLEILHNKDISTYTEVSSLEPSRNYTNKITINVNRSTLENRNRFEQMMVTGDIMIAILDYNDNYWLMGEDNGCIATTSTNFETYQGRQTMTIEFTSIERHPMKRLDGSFIFYYLPVGQVVISFSGTTWLFALSWQEFIDQTW